MHDPRGGWVYLNRGNAGVVEMIPCKRDRVLGIQSKVIEKFEGCVGCSSNAICPNIK